MTTSEDPSGAIAQLAPSDRLVLEALRRSADGELSRQALLARTMLPERTLDRALRRLEEYGLILKARGNGDARRIVAILSG